MRFEWVHEPGQAGKLPRSAHFTSGLPSLRVASGKALLASSSFSAKFRSIWSRGTTFTVLSASIVSKIVCVALVNHHLLCWLPSLVEVPVREPVAVSVALSPFSSFACLWGALARAAAPRPRKAVAAVLLLVLLLVSGTSVSPLTASFCLSLASQKSAARLPQEERL